MLVFQGDPFLLLALPIWACSRSSLRARGRASDLDDGDGLVLSAYYLRPHAGDIAVDGACRRNRVCRRRVDPDDVPADPTLHQEADFVGRFRGNCDCGQTCGNKNRHPSMSTQDFEVLVVAAHVGRLPVVERVDAGSPR